MIGLLKSEVAKGLRGESVDVRHKARVGVVFDVATLDEVLHRKERVPLSLRQLYDVRLEEIHLYRTIGTEM